MLGETPLMSACYGTVSEPDQLGLQCTLVCAAIIHVNGIYTVCVNKNFTFRSTNTNLER